MKNKMMIGLMTASAVLAVMGCWFCWYCPSRIYEAHELFWKQIAGNVIGLVVFLGVVVLGWRRLLKVAPWLMGIWILAFVVAHCQRPINGAHRWLVLDGILPVPFSMIHINVLTCFMPAFALFVAWLHEKKWIRVWMRWCFWGALVFGAVWYVVGSESRMMRIVAFLHPSYETFRYSYMGEQLQAAFSVANWFGDSGHKLYLLPCPESDGMMAASALLFGKWFPTLVCVVFGFAGALLAMVWQGVLDVSKRWSVLLFAAWFLLPAAYCHFQALGLLPVAGFSPALVGASGTAVVMVWFGLGVLAAMMRDGQQMPKQSRYNWWGVGISMGVMIVAVLAMAWASHEDRKFYEKIPDKEPSDPFASLPERGAIVAADGSLLACPARKWSFHLDPKFPIDKDAIRSCADELSIVFELPKEKLLMDFLRTDSRYIPLKDVEDDGIEDLWYRNRGRHLKRYGLIREPLQGRRTLLGDAALPVVGTVHRTLAKQVPEGASGLEYLFDKVLKGKDGGSGGIVHTTIVPSLQKKFDAILVDACVTNSAKAAWGIALKIPFGEIVAMASVKGGTNGTVHSSFNGAAHSNFEPGGLVKPLTYAIALNEGILKWDSKLDQGEGIWEYNGNTIRDKVKGLVSISEALSNRVNIAACKTALEIGAE